MNEELKKAYDVALLALKEIEKEIDEPPFNEDGRIKAINRFFSIIETALTPNAEKEKAMKALNKMAENERQHITYAYGSDTLAECNSALARSAKREEIIRAAILTPRADKTLDIVKKELDTDIKELGEECRGSNDNSMVLGALKEAQRVRAIIRESEGAK